MALTHYIDGSDAPQLNADAYITEAEGDLFLAFLPAWTVLTSEQKEAKIKEATALIDSLQFGGAPVGAADAQTLQFPRNFSDSTDDPWTLAEQKRRIRRAVCAQIEYNLNRQGLGALQFSRGDLSATISQETLCRPALFALSAYMAA